MHEVKDFRGMRMKTLLTCALVALMLVVAACGAPAAPAAPTADSAAPPAAEEAAGAEAEAAAAGEVVTIRGMANDAFARAWQERLIPEFERLYPNIKVEVDAVPYSDILPKSMLELTAPEVLYDFIITDDPWTPQTAQAGLLADLSQFEGYNSEEYDLADIHPSPLAAGEWDGVQYGVPVRSNLLLMFYNRSLFESAGLDADEVLDGITWDELPAILEQLVQDTDGDGTVDAWAIGSEFSRGVLAPTRWQTIFNANGGQLLDENLRPVFNTEVGAEALQTNLDWMQYGPPGIEQMDYNAMNEAFRQGKIAIMLNWGSVFRASAIDPETTTLTAEEVGISAMPGGTACEQSAHRGVYVAVIPSGSAHQQEAWDFIQWLSSKEGEQFTSAELGQFPARISTLNGEAPEPWLAPVFSAILDGYDGIECGSMWRPRLPDSDAVSQILATHHSRAVLGEASPAEALDDAAAEIEQFLEEEGYYE